MDGRLLAAVLIVACVTGLAGCKPGQGGDAERQRQALTQRVEGYKRDAVQSPVLTPARKAELQQLATEVRAWQAKTGRNDVRVTKDNFTAARMNDGGGAGGCEDCPGYRVDGDRICFLEIEGECPVDDGGDLQLGRVCVYTCIWIGSEVEPARKGG